MDSKMYFGFLMLRRFSLFVTFSLRLLSKLVL